MESYQSGVRLHPWFIIGAHTIYMNSCRIRSQLCSISVSVNQLFKLVVISAVLRTTILQFLS